MTNNETLNNLVWAEKYRPSTLEQAILPESTKKMIRSAIDSNNLPHLLLCGTAGTGKTTLVRLIANETDSDLLFINASLNGNIDTIRTQVIQFSSTVSMTGGNKIVVLDECDGMTQSAQQSLRGVIEEFKNTRFFFTCNFPNKVIDAIHSRCTVIDFKTTKEEAPKLQGKFFKRVCEILTNEQVEFEKPVVAELIKKNYPDFRKILNELQRYGSSGKIDSGILLNQTEETFAVLIKALKEKNFTDMRKWVGNNPDFEVHTVNRMLFDMSFDNLEPKCIPELILKLDDYNIESMTTPDKQITLTASLIETMMIAVWK